MASKRKTPAQPTARPRYYSYSRFSSIEQAGGDSLDRQEHLLAEWCQRNGVSLDEVHRYSDEAISAFRGRNATEGALAEFVALVESGAVPKGSVLIVEAMHRLSRDKPRAAMLRVMQLIENGIVIQCLSPERRFDDATTNDWALIEAFVAAKLAHDESANKSRVSSRNWTQKRKAAADKPLTAQCPAWLKMKADRSGFEIIVAKANWVRKAFALAIDGMGSNKIAQRLDKLTEGKSIVQRKRHSGSTKWEPSYIHQLMRDRAVLGEYQPHRKVEKQVKEGTRTVIRMRNEPTGEPVRGYYPAIIDEATWAQARAAIAARKKHAGGPNNVRVRNIFGDLLADARTGEKCMVRGNGNGPQGSYQRLITSVGSVAMGPVEDALLRLFSDELRLGEDDGQQAAAAEADGLEARIGTLQATIETKMAELIANPDPDSLHWDIVHRMGDEVKRLKPLLASARQKMETKPAQDMDRLKAALHALRRAKGEAVVDARLKVRGRLKRVVKRIWVLIVQRPYFNSSRKLCWRSRVEMEAHLVDGQRCVVDVDPERAVKGMPVKESDRKARRKAKAKASPEPVPVQAVEADDDDDDERLDKKHGDLEWMYDEFGFYCGEFPEIGDPNGEDGWGDEDEDEEEEDDPDEDKVVELDDGSASRWPLGYIDEARSVDWPLDEYSKHVDKDTLLGPRDNGEGWVHEARLDAEEEAAWERQAGNCVVLVVVDGGKPKRARATSMNLGRFMANYILEGKPCIVRDGVRIGGRLDYIPLHGDTIMITSPPQE